MKTSKMVGLALVAIALGVSLTSCSKDDPTKEESGTVVNEKKLTKIDFSDGHTSYGYISFTYDDKGRLTKAEQINDSGNSFTETMIWGDDAVKINTSDKYNGKEENNSYTLPLANGLVQSYSFNKSQYTPIYNQSNKLIEWGKERSMTSIIWDGDKLVSATEDAYGYIRDYTLTYEKSCNKGYFPLLGDLIDVGHGFYLFLAHPELLGLRTTQLPKTMTSTYENEDSNVDSFSYELDKEGYISKMTTTYSDVGSWILTWE